MGGLLVNVVKVVYNHCVWRYYHQSMGPVKPGDPKRLTYDEFLKVQPCVLLLLMRFVRLYETLASSWG